MPIKPWPENLDLPPADPWPGWEHEHDKLELIVDSYHRASDRYEVLVNVNRSGPSMGSIELMVLDYKTSRSYSTEEYFADAGKLAQRIDELKPKLSDDANLEAYLAELEKQYAKPAKPSTKPPPPGGKKPKRKR